MSLFALLASLLLSMSVVVENTTTDRITVFRVCGIAQRLGDVEALSDATFTTAPCHDMSLTIRVHPSRREIRGEKFYAVDGDVVTLRMTSVGPFVSIRRAQ